MLCMHKGNQFIFLKFIQKYSDIFIFMFSNVVSDKMKFITLFKKESVLFSLRHCAGKINIFSSVMIHYS